MKDETKNTPPPAPAFIPADAKIISLRNFFEAWRVPRSILAERLRRDGIWVTMYELMHILQLEDDQLTERERRILMRGVELIVSDIMKIKKD